MAGLNAEALGVLRAKQGVPLLAEWQKKAADFRVTVYTCDPLDDRRWEEFVRTHPASSIFHTRGWLGALQSTYGYEPVVYTTSPPATNLTNGIALCLVRSWLTGRRMVSVPFSDHCEPLVASLEDCRVLVDALCSWAGTGRKYVELRPLRSGTCDHPRLEKADSFHFHFLDLRPTIEELFGQAHRSTIQRKIRRAEREGLLLQVGRSDALLNDFYRLMLLTRRRHGLPPQPIEWFRNLIACLGDRVTIRVAAKDGRAIGSILTLAHRDTLVYKYGCSDARFHNLGVMPFLFWKAIQDAKADGLVTFDLGRSDFRSEGLIAFKERLGATATTSTYVRCSAGRRRQTPPRFRMGLPKALVARMPDRMLIMAGRLLYRHLG